MISLIDTADLRYPIGQFTPLASSMAGIRAAHIATLRLLPERLEAALAGLDETKLDTPYRDGGWTVRQVVHHVADSHANAFIRFKLALTEDWPSVRGYDQERWAELPDARLPVSVSLDLLRALHVRWIALLEPLGEDDFRKGYLHNEYGKLNLAQALASYDWHCRHHTAHITRLRERKGW